MTHINTDASYPDILFRITGGLGNQMFQYACAKSLQLKYGVNVKLDIQQSQWHARRRYELKKFAVSLPIATIYDINHFCSQPLSINNLSGLDWLAKKAEQRNSWRIMFRKILKMNVLHPDKYLFNEDPEHMDSINLLEQPVYFDGYWQNVDYFRSIDDIIRKEFSLITTPIGSLKAWQKRIQKHQCAVSVHIRRGDYLSKKVSAMFDVLSMDYYHAAMNRIIESFEDAVFIIFSDDPLWVKKHFSETTYACEIVDGNHEGYDDMYLMSQCRHHIIANSTFSWWGAWLGSSADQQVIAPEQWGLSDSVKKITGGIIPPEWERV